MEVLDMLKNAVKIERTALETLEETIDKDYLEAISLMQSREGKIIFMGVGKSGHIGQKLAATFSSLGELAIFVHASEAVHGDLGMIASQDVVFLLSNSGETSEILKTLPTLNSLKVIKIAITGNKNSILAQNVDLVLTYEYTSEADHLHIAPTTSTTIMMAIGDALAVTLSELNSFTCKEFKLYHPGGEIGSRLLDLK